MRWLLIWGVLLATGSGRAQAVDPAYAGLEAAGKFVQGSKTLPAAVGPNATLGQKEEAALDAGVRKGLESLRAWLAKPVAPMTDFDPADKTFAETLKGAETLAQALAVRQYVALADGRVGEALEWTRLGLQLAFALKPHSVKAWQTAASIEEKVILPLGKRLDLLALKDCEILRKLAVDWEKAANGLPVMLERERKAALKAFPQKEGEVRDLFAEMDKRLTQSYTAEPLAAPSPELAELATQSWDVLTKERKRLAAARMLVCHALIRQYRWENNTPPVSLEMVKPGDVGADPFSGQEFVYKVRNREYTLLSVGPFARKPDGSPDLEKREPFSLTPLPPN